MQYIGRELRVTASRQSALDLLLSDAKIVLCLAPDLYKALEGSSA